MIDAATSEVDDLEIERAERVERPVTSADGSVATAIDCLVRASRPGPRS